VKTKKKEAEPLLVWEKCGRSYVASVAGSRLSIKRGPEPYLGGPRPWRIDEVFGMRFIAGDYPTFNDAALEAEGVAQRWLTKAISEWERLGSVPLLKAMQKVREPLFKKGGRRGS
jgi:hypothetical protein